MTAPSRVDIAVAPVSEADRARLLRVKNAEGLEESSQALPEAYAEAYKRLNDPEYKKRLKLRAVRQARKDLEAEGVEASVDAMRTRGQSYYNAAIKHNEEIYRPQLEAAKKKLSESSPVTENMLTPAQILSLRDTGVAPPTPSQIVIKQMQQAAGGKEPLPTEELVSYYHDAATLRRAASRGEAPPEEVVVRRKLNDPDATEPKSVPGKEAWWETGLRGLSAIDLLKEGAVTGYVRGAQQIAPADYTAPPIDTHMTSPVTGVANVLRLIEQGLAKASGVEIPLELDTNTTISRNVLGVDSPTFIKRMLGLEATPEVQTPSYTEDRQLVPTDNPYAILLRNIAQSAVKNTQSLNAPESILNTLNDINVNRDAQIAAQVAAENPNAPAAVVAAKAQQRSEAQRNADMGEIALENPMAASLAFGMFSPTPGMSAAVRLAGKAAKRVATPLIKSAGLHKTFSVVPEAYGLSGRAEDIGSMTRLAHDTATVAQKEYQALIKEPLEELLAAQKSPHMDEIWDLMHTPVENWTDEMRAFAQTPDARTVIESSKKLEAARATMRAKYPHLAQRIETDEAGREIVGRVQDIEKNQYVPHMLDERNLVKEATDSSVDPNLVKAQTANATIHDMTPAAAHNRKEGTQPVRNVAAQWAHSIDSDLRALKHHEELAQMAKLGEEAGMTKFAHIDDEAAMAPVVQAKAAYKAQKAAYKAQKAEWAGRDALDRVGIATPSDEAVKKAGAELVGAAAPLKMLARTKEEVADFKLTQAAKYGASYVDVGDADDLVKLLPGTAGTQTHRKALAETIARDLSRIMGKPGETAGTHHLVIPRAMAERHINLQLKYSAKVAQKETNAALRIAGHMAQNMQRVFRTTVTMTPRAVKGNALGAWWSNFMANGATTALNPAFNAKVMEAAIHSTAEEGPGWLGKAMRGVPEVLMDEPIKAGSKITVRQALKAAQDSNAVNLYQLHMSEEALSAARKSAQPAGSILTRLGKGAETVTHKMAEGASQLAEASGGRAMNEVIDNYQKLSVFMGRLDGLDPVSVSKARDAVRKYGMDYSNIGADAKIKEAFGFYSFMRQGLAGVLYLAGEHPERFSKVLNAGTHYWRAGQGGSPLADDTGRRYLESPTPESAEAFVRKIREGLKDGSLKPNEVNFRSLVDEKVVLGRLESPLLYFAPIVSVAEMIAGKDAPDDVVAGLFGPIVMLALDATSELLSNDEVDIKDRADRALTAVEKRFVQPLSGPLRLARVAAGAAKESLGSDKPFDVSLKEHWMELPEALRAALEAKFQMTPETRRHPGNTRVMYPLNEVAKKARKDVGYIKDERNEGLFKPQ